MKKVVIVAVSLANTARVTNLSSDWLTSAAAKVADYFRHQSGGRLVLEITVADWTEAPYTYDEWMALGFNARIHIQKLITDSTGFDFSPFDHFMLIIDVEKAGGGVSVSENDTIIAAVNASPSIMSHELGHSLGAGHTFLGRTPGEMIEYAGQYSPMGGFVDGGRWHPYWFPLSELYQDGGYYRTMIGPNMCVPNLVQAGWLDVQKHVARIPTFADGAIHSNLRLYALDGAPPQDATPHNVAFRVEDGDVFVGEFRSNKTFYDQSIPHSNPYAPGWLLIHRMPADGSWLAYQVAEIPARAGESVSLQDPALSLFGSMPLSVSILSVDDQRPSILIAVHKTAPKVPKYERTEELMDFLQWGIADAEVLGSLDDDIKSGLQSLARLHHLRVLERVAGPENSKELREAQVNQARNLRSLSNKVTNSAIKRSRQ